MNLKEEISEIYRKLVSKFPAHSNRWELKHHLRSHFFICDLLEERIKIVFYKRLNLNGLDLHLYIDQSFSCTIFASVYYQLFLQFSVFGFKKYYDGNVLGYPFKNFDLFKVVIKSYLQMLNLVIANRGLAYHLPRLIIGGEPNIGHYIWNELSAIESIQCLKNRNLLKHVSFGKYDFFKMKSMLNIPVEVENELHRKKFADFKITELVLSQSVIDILIEAKKIRMESKDNIVIQIRRHNRIWEKELDGVARVIRHILVNNKTIEVYIDGFSRYGVDDVELEKNINREEEFFDQLSQAVKFNSRLKSLIGADLDSKLGVYSRSIINVGPIGSGGVLACWIFKTPCIVYGPISYYEWTSNDSATVVENASHEWRFLDKKAITMMPNGIDYNVNVEALILELQMLLDSQIVSPQNSVE